MMMKKKKKRSGAVLLSVRNVDAATVGTGCWCASTVIQEGSAVEEEISDGELTDLLAEVDETPSTSSRLRPSTINQPSSSSGRRHSQRIQSRASSSPDPRPETSW
eukprot:superscaffoldBa00014727_g26426